MKSPSAHSMRTGARLFAVALLPLLALLVAQPVFGDSLWIQKSVHECFKLVGSCIALAVAMLLLLQMRGNEAPSHLIWVIASLVATGLADGIHGIAPVGSIWSWLHHGTTLVAGLLFAMVWLPAPAIVLREKEKFILAEIAVVFAAVGCTIWFSSQLTTPWREGGYVPMVKWTNGIGGLGYLAAMVFFFRRYTRSSQAQDLAFACFAMLFAAACLPYGFSRIWTADWWLLLGLRLLAYLMVLGVGYQSVTKLYGDVAQRTAQLEDLNRALREENAERRRAEQSARAERQRFNDVLDQLPAYLVLLSPDYHVPFANRFFRERFGESHGRRCYEYLFNRSEPCEHCETYSVLKTNACHHWEWTGPDQRNYAVHDFPFKDSDGSTLIMEVGLDVTEARKAAEQIRVLNASLEQRVRERTRELQAVFDAAPIGLCIAEDPEARRIRGNRTLEDILGVARGAELSKHPARPMANLEFHVFCDERELKPEELPMRRAARGETVTGHIMDVLRSDGRVVKLYSNAVPLYDDQGRPRGAIGTFLDITELRRAEEALRASEERHRLLFETTLQGVVYQDSHGAIISMNPAAERILGQTPGELLGQTSSSLQHHTWREDGSPFPGREHPAMVALSTGQEVRNVVMRVFNPKKQTHCWININAKPLFRPGEDSPYQVYTIFDDITDRKQTEDKIRRLNEQLASRAASLEQANKELESFSYSVSHDLRAPLRAIDGFSRILLEEYQANLPERAQTHLQRVRVGTQRMGRLIDDILLLSRVTRQELALEPVNLSELAAVVGEDLQNAHPEHPVEFIVTPNITARGDARLLRIMLENLLGNAWKFTGKQSKPRVEFGLTATNGVPVCYVRDNGAGFDMAFAQNLFGAFRRLHSNADFPGTGIGLATVQRIVHRHGGQVWAESAVGLGATFFFTLPTPTLNPKTWKGNNDEKQQNNSSKSGDAGA